MFLGHSDTPFLNFNLLVEPLYSKVLPTLLLRAVLARCMARSNKVSEIANLNLEVYVANQLDRTGVRLLPSLSHRSDNQL